jgi:post-segregation antitoxin (ccd killing protein)
MHYHPGAQGINEPAQEGRRRCPLVAADRGGLVILPRCVIFTNTMKARAGKTATFSVSVDQETQRILKAEANRSYGGNVSALVTAIAKEAKRQSALDWLLQRAEAAPMTAAECDGLLAEIDGTPAPKKRRRRAA